MKKDKEKKKKRAKREHLSADVSTPDLEPQPAPLPEEPVPAGQEDALRLALKLVGGRWKLPILWALRSGEGLRYGEIRQQVAGITDMMLSQSLRELTADNLTQRSQYQEIPPRVEYTITPAGAERLPVIEQFRVWAAGRNKERK